MQSSPETGQVITHASEAFPQTPEIEMTSESRESFDMYLSRPNASPTFMVLDFESTSTTGVNLFLVNRYSKTTAGSIKAISRPLNELGEKSFTGNIELLFPDYKTRDPDILATLRDDYGIGYSRWTQPKKDRLLSQIGESSKYLTGLASEQIPTQLFPITSKMMGGYLLTQESMSYAFNQTLSEKVISALCLLKKEKILNMHPFGRNLPMGEDAFIRSQIEEELRIYLAIGFTARQMQFEGRQPIIIVPNNSAAVDFINKDQGTHIPVINVNTTKI